MIKVLWMFRAIWYKFFMDSFGLMSYIGKPIYISNFSNLSFGRKVRIYPLARIEAFKTGKIIIGDDVSIGQCLHIISGCRIVIGERSTLSANVFISDVEHNYTGIDEHVMHQSLDSFEIEIGKNCFVGYGAVIRAGTRLGRQCIVGANSVVKGVFPDYCVIAGNPAKIIKKYDVVSQRWERVDGEMLR